MAKSGQEDGTWYGEVKKHLAEWGPTPKTTVIMRLTPLMPPGYSWQRYVIDSRLVQRMEARGEWDEGDPFPAPKDLDDYAKAQRHLALRFLGQLRRSGRLVEEDGLMSLRD